MQRAAAAAEARQVGGREQLKHRGEELRWQVVHSPGALALRCPPTGQRPLSAAHYWYCTDKLQQYQYRCCSHFHTTAGKKITKQYIDTMQRRSKTVAGGVRGRGRGRCPAAVQSAGPGQWTFPSSVYMCAMKLEALR